MKWGVEPIKDDAKEKAKDGGWDVDEQRHKSHGIRNKMMFGILKGFRQ